MEQPSLRRWSTILLTKSSPFPTSYSTQVSAYLRLMLTHSPPMPLHRTDFCFCFCCHLPDDFPFSSVWLPGKQETGKNRKGKWIWVVTLSSSVCMLFLFKPLATLSNLAILWLCLHLHNPGCISPPTQHLHHWSWMRLEWSTQSWWLTWNSWSWTSRESPGFSLQSLCISLVHSISYSSAQPFPSYLLPPPQTSSTSSHPHSQLMT